MVVLTATGMARGSGASGGLSYAGVLVFGGTGDTSESLAAVSAASRVANSRVAKVVLAEVERVYKQEQTLGASRCCVRRGGTAGRAFTAAVY